MATTPPKTVDAYLAAQPKPARDVLQRVRATLRKALPGATEGISYQIPIYKLDGAMVLYFAGFRDHYSIYPATPRLIEELEEELAGYLHNKATLRFSYEEAVPTRLIARMAKVRAAEAAERKAGRGAKTAGSKGTKPASGRKAPRKGATKRS